jgi:hypothetical protein
VSAFERVAFWTFRVGAVAFFIWVAMLAVRE